MPSQSPSEIARRSGSAGPYAGEDLLYPNLPVLARTAQSAAGSSGWKQLSVREKC